MLGGSFVILVSLILGPTTAQTVPVGCPLFNASCHCIPEPAVNVCPATEKRKSDVEYSMDKSLLSLYSTVKPRFVSAVPKLCPDGCNPYPSIAAELKTSACFRPATFKNAACFFVYNCKGPSYKLMTLPLKSLGKIPGAVLTHEGPCGVCSSAADLVTWMNPALDQKSFQCGFVPVRAGLTGSAYLSNATQCFQDLGFSRDCAYVWASNAYNTNNANCTQTCVEWLSGQKPSLPNVPPGCDLHPCLQCDETNSGAIFEKFSGRTRRRSGILTHLRQPNPSAPALPIGLKRRCNETANIAQINPCQ